MKRAAIAGCAVVAVAWVVVGCRTASRSSNQLAGEEPMAAGIDCTGMEPQGDVLEWLRKYQTQAELSKIFNCAPPTDPSRIPLGQGQGYGSVFNQWPVLNSFQNAIGRHLWGGKRFYKAGDEVHLINKMLDTGTERYKAKVYRGVSIRDGKAVVVLDYRGDDSVATLGAGATFSQKAVDKIVHGIRDEIREIYQNGKPTSVFIGRANLYKRMMSLSNFASGNFGFPIPDEVFSAADSWFLGANFFLDFREAVATPPASGPTPVSGSGTGGAP